MGKLFPTAALSGDSYAPLSSKAPRELRLRFPSLAWTPAKHPGRRIPRLPRGACLSQRRSVCHQHPGAVEKGAPAECHTDHPVPVELRESARRACHRASRSPRAPSLEVPRTKSRISLHWGGRRPCSLSPHTEPKQAAALRCGLHDVGRVPGWLYDPWAF